jgi:C4-dicarboxylate-specific signal transduction histidine kinase
VFTFFENLVGLGTMGGVATDFSETGRRVARLVLRLLEGEAPDALPVELGGPNRVILDARQLDRLGVPDARVPPGAEVRFRDPSGWEQHRWTIALALAAFGLQSALITLLLLERRKRWRAEARARENLAEVAHMNRVAALGELVGSLAHEINSPLGAVLNNAEAAQRFMAQGAGVHGVDAEVRSCLDDIAKDVTRAGDVIRRIRGVLRREAWTPVELEVGEVIRDAYHLVAADARDRGVSVDVQVAPGLPPVTGDEVQLVQVLVNLLLNAFDAVRSVPEARRDVRISAEPRGGRVALRVADSGPGVPAAVAGRVFEPFFTTKPAGLGLGLSITRSIVEAHGGSIALSQAPGGGAVFEVLLPPSEGAPAAGHAEAAG